MIEQKITSSLTAAPNHNIMGIFRNKQLFAKTNLQLCNDVPLLTSEVLLILKRI